MNAADLSVYPTPPRGLRWRSNTFFILSTVAIAMFTDLFIYGVVVPILPFILEDVIGVEKSQVQAYTSLLLACYAGASVLFSLPAGILADKLPARLLPFLAGLCTLLTSTSLLFFARSINALIVARILQGISAAVVWTVGLALVQDTVGSENLGVSIGSIFSFISVGGLAAPVLGGIVYKSAGTNGVFGMVSILLAVDFFMRLAVIEKKVAVKYGLQDEQVPDNAGDGGTDHHDEEQGGEPDDESPLLQSSRKQDDLDQWKIPEDQPKWISRFPILYCLSNSRLITAQIITVTHAIIVSVFDATLPIEVQDLFGFDSLKAGLVFVPLAIPDLIFGPLGGKFVDKYGTKAAATIGFGFYTIPLILFRIPQPGGSEEIIKFCAILALCGLGFAIISSPALVESTYVIEQYHKSNKDFFGENGPYGQLYAINSLVFSLGMTLGPLIAGALRERIGYGNMNAVVAILSLISSVLSFMFLGGPPRLLLKNRS